MKKLFALILMCTVAANISAQTDSIEVKENRSSITLGILQGGGSLVGADLEFLLTDRVGFQLGGGVFGFGGGLNFHLKPGIHSSFISFQYWHQGIGDTFTQSVMGPNFVYRSQKWFTFQIGLGASLDKGPAMPEDWEQPPAMLMYSIGAFIPFE